jgi:hypothetical protein
MTPHHSNGDFDILELKIAHEKELRLKSEENSALNLKNQAAEYKLHFEELNHAHANSMKDREELLRSSVYDTFLKDFQAWKLEVSTMLAAREASYAAAQRVWGVIILFGATILSVLISHFWH